MFEVRVSIIGEYSQIDLPSINNIFFFTSVHSYPLHAAFLQSINSIVHFSLCHCNKGPLILFPYPVIEKDARAFSKLCRKLRVARKVIRDVGGRKLQLLSNNFRQ